MICDVNVNNYDADSMYGYYLKLSSDELLSEYQAVKACQDILLSGSSAFGNSYLAEFTDSVIVIMCEVMVERYIEMVTTGQSACKIVRLG